MTSLITSDSRSRQPSKPWTQAEDDILRSNHTKPIREFLSLLPGRAYNTVYMRLRKRGLPITKGAHGLAWSQEDQDYLRSHFGKVPWPELCQRLGRKEHTISEYARRRGLILPRDKNGDTVNTAHKPSLRRLLDGSLQSSYWWGYLMADGYMFPKLGQIVLCSADADKDQMKRFADYLGGANVLRYQTRSPFTGALMWTNRVSVADCRSAPVLAKLLDWNQQKTYNPPSCDVLDKTLAEDDHFMAFVVGFSDGDGSITPDEGLKIENHRSWFSFHQWLVRRVSKAGFKTTEAHLNGNGYSVAYLRRAFVHRLRDFILSHKLPVLDRKWSALSL